MPVGKNRGKKVSVTTTEAENIERAFGKYSEQASPSLQGQLAYLKEKITDQAAELDALHKENAKLKEDLEKATKPAGGQGGVQ